MGNLLITLALFLCAFYAFFNTTACLQMLATQISSLDSGVQALNEVAGSLTWSENVSGRVVVGRSMAAVKHRLNRLKARTKVCKMVSSLRALKRGAVTRFTP